MERDRTRELWTGGDRDATSAERRSGAALATVTAPLGGAAGRCYDAAMETREKTFVLRFTLEAQIPEALFEDEDFEEDAWLDEWEVGIKPGLIRAVFAQLRATPAWSARVRNRGVSPLDEIEIVVTRRLGGDPENGTEDDDEAQ